MVMVHMGHVVRLATLSGMYSEASSDPPGGASMRAFSIDLVNQIDVSGLI